MERTTGCKHIGRAVMCGGVLCGMRNVECGMHLACQYCCDGIGPTSLLPAIQPPSRAAPGPAPSAPQPPAAAAAAAAGPPPRDGGDDGGGGASTAQRLCPRHEFHPRRPPSPQLHVDRPMRPLTHDADVWPPPRPPSPQLHVDRPMRPLTHDADVWPPPRPPSPELHVDRPMRPLTHDADVWPPPRPPSPELPVGCPMRPLAHDADVWHHTRPPNSPDSQGSTPSSRDEIDAIRRELIDTVERETCPRADADLADHLADTLQQYAPEQSPDQLIVALFFARRAHPLGDLTQCCSRVHLEFRCALSESFFEARTALDEHNKETLRRALWEGRFAPLGPCDWDELRDLHNEVAHLERSLRSARRQRQPVNRP
jgi:hypothetical protein